MAIFDQRNQTVIYQVNTAIAREVEAAQSTTEVIDALERIRLEVSAAHASGALDKITHDDATHEIKQAQSLLEQEPPSSKDAESRLSRVRDMFSGISAASGLASLIVTVLRAIAGT